MGVSIESNTDRAGKRIERSNCLKRIEGEKNSEMRVERIQNLV